MPIEITVLALGALLLVVHITVAVHYTTQQYGLGWNMGARDEQKPPLGDVAARLQRARDNFLETLPIAIIALFGVVLTGKTSELTALFAWLWLGARVIYLPLYWAGIPYIRTVAWFASMFGLLGVLYVLLAG
ncbi:MAPEG family protein [Altererythrobacter sp.]|uniref:MAPEG family protein n=1 Tax=Altererythrobacter sp. TaxID=1872480 RepID=UPI003CFDF607